MSCKQLMGMQGAGFLLSLGGSWICPKGLDWGLGMISCQLKAKITSSYSPPSWVLGYSQSSVLPVLPRSVCEGPCSPAASLPNPSPTFFPTPSHLL